jgi:Right handed beta helix region
MPTKRYPDSAAATVVSLAVIVILALAGLVAMSGAEAAGNPKCGDVITTDTTLHKDLVDCPNNGIVIGADNVTLDLNGHLVDGDGTEASGCNPSAEVCDTGVVDDGHDGVTVKQGRVREFGVGVLFGTSTAGTVRHNRVLGVSSSRNLFFGFVLASTARSLVRNSSGSDNIAPEGDGMGLFAAHHVRIVHNSFRHNPGPGIHVAESTRNLIKGNLLSRDGPAILLEADRNEVRGNRIIRGGGIAVAPGNRNVIARNRISHTTRAGGVGIEVDGGDHNVIARNSVRDTAGDAISVGFSAAVGNVVRRNHIRRAGKDGVDVDDKARHTLLKRNHVFGANDDGLDANNSTTKLAGNEARRNGDLGIEAVLGVIDGGGNEASGNGDPFQCTHTMCS